MPLISIMEQQKNKREVPESTFEMVSGWRQEDELPAVPVYGIRATTRWQDKTQTETLEDVGTDRKEVEELIDLLQKEKIRGRFLQEFIEDYLEERYGVEYLG